MTAIGKEWLAALSSKLGSRSGKHRTARGSCVGSIDAAVDPGSGAFTFVRIPTWLCHW